MELGREITAIKGVGSAMAKQLKLLGIETVEQLLDNFPRRYEDYSHITPAAQLKPGHVTVKATLHEVHGKYVRRGLHVTEAVARDETGSVRVIWFNQPYRAQSLRSGAQYYISGLFELRRQRLAIVNPSIEQTRNLPRNTARILPVYRETKQLSSKQIRKIVFEVLAAVGTLPETLPDSLLNRYRLVSRTEAVRAIHFPQTAQQLREARGRLGFEEVFELSLASLLNKYELLQQKAISIPFDEQLARRFVAHLPFSLTDAQRKAIWQIYRDLERTQPMNRLLEGDVGSGKTVVATMAALMALKHGFQVALMAPTELLARQHADTIRTLLKPLKLANRVSVLVGGLKAAHKQKTHERIKSGEAQFIIGTHALIQQKVDMQNLGLVIIDEQHRFGVEQRKKLQAKAGHMPHVLSMTATPIPRSLALTLYGELDISIMDTKPANRKPIVTQLVSPHSRSELYRKVDEQLASGRQAFVVAPFISAEAANAALSAENICEQLKDGPFKHRRVGLLHGKQKAEEKNRVMERFASHELDILVATTVIEVGVNVPNASVMIIEGAERFGLAQIHQLRGRVGRSKHQGYCYLITEGPSAPSRRLRALESSHDGFELAELDLEIRGPGAIYGTAQHGALDLRLAKLTDTKLIARARQAAQAFIDDGQDLVQYKHLFTRVQRLRAVTNLN